jgi:deazaflavin-dependent oxidoreductase (nitroreductase family)
MTHNEPIFDSPDETVREHIADYVASDGKSGHLWRGRPTLLLTTRGRKSGKLRRTALIYGRAGDNYLVIASNDGSEYHPAWLLNLAEHPDVEVQAGAEKFAARATIAAPEEKARLWPVMSAIFPTYDRYQAETRRDIPLVILEPVASAEEVSDR